MKRTIREKLPSQKPKVNLTVSLPNRPLQARTAVLPIAGVPDNDFPKILVPSFPLFWYYFWRIKYPQSAGSGRWSAGR